MLYDIMVVMQLVLMSMILLMFMYKYMLILLLLMELVVINIGFLLFLVFTKMSLEFYLIYYLIFSVCESVLGLGLLVMIVRQYGSELYYMFNVSKY
uniref:NADH dehydrogenase subunit 4L n=1 Tax=Stenamma megamanni TaxID=1504014 RepID=UPI001FCD9889|nr:NADH dehydrogenase subunit 4L [Stenamma megamanni]UNZ99573.1 NADH dehydrogenase subunit 4L [Stenamma megamanni]